MTTNRGLRAFTWAEVDAIRRRYAEGESQGKLARAYCVTINTIGRIVRGETYVENSRVGVDQPYGRPHVDLNDPESVKKLGERIMANAKALGPIDPELLGVKEYVPDGTERQTYRYLGKWPKGFTPSQEDLDWAAGQG